MYETVDVMHRRGFRVLFAVQPFISTESSSFSECLQAGYFVGMIEIKHKIILHKKFRLVNQLYNSIVLKLVQLAGVSKVQYYPDIRVLFVL